MYKQNEWLLRENKTVELAVNITEPLDPRQITYDIAPPENRGKARLFNNPRFVELEEAFSYEFKGQVARPEVMVGYWVNISVGKWPYEGTGIVGDGLLDYKNFDLRLRLPHLIAKELFEHLLRWGNAPKDHNLFPAVENPTGLTGKLWDFTCGIEHFKQGIPHKEKVITFQISGAYF
jgi:hypothetical protein